jgi:hypothetical protein
MDYGRILSELDDLNWKMILTEENTCLNFLIRKISFCCNEHKFTRTGILGLPKLSFQILSLVHGQPELDGGRAEAMDCQRCGLLLGESNGSGSGHNLDSKGTSVQKRVVIWGLCPANKYRISRVTVMLMPLNRKAIFIFKISA